MSKGEVTGNMEYGIFEFDALTRFGLKHLGEESVTLQEERITYRAETKKHEPLQRRIVYMKPWN